MGKQQYIDGKVVLTHLPLAVFSSVVCALSRYPTASGSAILGLSMSKKPDPREYWRRNLRYVAILLTIWFLVSYGCGILFVDELDQIRLGGFKLGFWFAQQGSIYVFVALIFIYVWLMNRLDRSLDQSRADGEGVVGESDDERAGETGAVSGGGAR